MKVNVLYHLHNDAVRLQWQNILDESEGIVCIMCALHLQCQNILDESERIISFV